MKNNIPRKLPMTAHPVIRDIGWKKPIRNHGRTNIKMVYISFFWGRANKNEENPKINKALEKRR
jgi:hypothetical protein